MALNAQTMFPARELYGPLSFRRFLELTLTLTLAVTLGAGALVDLSRGSSLRGNLCLAGAYLLLLLALFLLLRSLETTFGRSDHGLGLAASHVLTPVPAVLAVGLLLTHVLLLARSRGRAAPLPLLPALLALAVVFVSLLAASGYGFLLARRQARWRGRLRALLARHEQVSSPEALARLRAFVTQELERPGEPSQLIRGTVFPGLSSRPFHDRSTLPFVRVLEASYSAIRAETLALLVAMQSVPRYDYVGVGSDRWRSLFFHRFGQPMLDHLRACPELARALAQVPGAHLREAMVSVLEPQGRIAPHRDQGNIFLTCHLGLRIPDHCELRVGGLAHTWREGECLVFDTSYLHEAVNNSKERRVVLLCDFWHPELTALERAFLAELMGLPRERAGEQTPA